MTIRTLRDDEPIPAGEPRRYKDRSGYIRLRWLVGPDQYVEIREHRLVMGRPDGEVHHLNGDKADNRPENLQVLTKEEHAHLHGAQAAAKPGKYAPYRCKADMECAQRETARREALRQRTDRMRQLYEAGLSTTEVGRIVGLDSSGVSRALRAAGVEMKPRDRWVYAPDIDVALVRQWHSEGVRAKEMCRRLGAGVGERRLRQLFDELGLPRFGPGNPHRKKAGAA